MRNALFFPAGDLSKFLNRPAATTTALIQEMVHLLLGKRELGELSGSTTSGWRKFS